MPDRLSIKRQASSLILKFLVMARICSFEIEYKNEHFPALVSIQQQADEIVCTIHFVESKLRYVVAGDTVIYRQKEGIVSPQNLPAELSAALQHCISKLLQ
jgi:hypothetical protein